MTNTIDLDLDVDLSPGDVAERLIMLPWLGIRMESVDTEEREYPLYQMGNADIDVVSTFRPYDGPGAPITLSDEAVGVHVPRRVELSFTSRKSGEGFNHNNRTSYRVLSWLIRHVPGNYFMAHEGGAPYACHVDGQTWVFDRAGAWNDERGWPEDWGLSVPYRFRRADAPPPDPLPPLRNAGAAAS